jgi:hypothetical protein
MRCSEEIINQEYNEVRVVDTLLNAGRLSQKDAQGMCPSTDYIASKLDEIHNSALFQILLCSK